MKMFQRGMYWLTLAVGALAVLGSMPAGLVADSERPDILVADFEWATWDESGWTVTGDAFGPGPAPGTLPNQMPVSGYRGERLVNSYHGGDGPTGTLTSPPVRIERNYLNFLIGGGGYEGQTCINLLIDGRVVHTATGPNTVPGGSEALDWHFWDVRALIGQQAVIQIVDEASGGWGHINVDHLVQSDRKIEFVTLHRELAVDRPLLHLPIKNGAPKRLMRLVVDGRLEREFEIELAEGEPDFWSYTETDAFLGRTLRVEVDRMPADSRALERLTLAETWPQQDQIYREALRPQFHFTPARGWTNDPNGMVYYDGEYHLFFQHNPYGVQWGNMTWGHAVSTDMIHWRQLPDAIHPDELGTIFSGSAVVDHENTTGWRAGEHPAIVAIYTSAGGTNPQSNGEPFTQSIAYSVDRGRTFTKHAGNPVLGHLVGGNRDPKVIWHEPTGQWVMILYLDRPRFALFGSPDLKAWTQLSELEFPDGHECPDLFELPVDGDPSRTRWVAWEAAGRYLIGSFDGTTFHRESGPHESRFGRHDYAAQTFSDIPAADGRRIQIAWMAGGQYPGMPFNQQMTVPRVLSLRTTPEGIRLFLEPVAELEQLRRRAHRWTDWEVPDEPVPLPGPAGDLFDIEVTFELDPAAVVGLDVRGQRIEYSRPDRQLTALESRAPLEPLDDRVTLRVLVDRASIEVFANGGRVQMASCFVPDADAPGLAVFARGAPAKIVSLVVWELASIWHVRE
jgi:fructan beta-fructosidase